ncbi:MAG: flagellar hook-associated protein FlgK [Oceanospirillaceae bacterium]|nr:flagellar hook-associated protein FlgK [Oceanospirillaceae bacterium]
MSSSLLSIGTQALNANSSALAYTGQNISNVNTEGYSRQRVDFATQEPPILGVTIQDVQRITDQFLEEQVRRDQSALSSTEQQSRKIELLDKLMISETTNLSAAMDSYFAAMQRTVDDPLFIANRQLFLAEANSLVSKFQNFDSRLEDQLATLSGESRSIVSSINAITSSLANLNVKIGSLASSGQNYNTLLDERTQLMKDLARYVSVGVVSSDGGITQTVVLASGEPLVSSGTAAKLTVADGNPNPSQIQVQLVRGTKATDVTSLLGEGELGGLFSYRDEILQPTRNEIGRLAMVFTETMNEQHRKGVDLDGLMGQDLFSAVMEGQFYAKRTNQTLTRPESELSYYDVSQLTASDYELEITGLNTFRIKRLSDGAIFDSNKMDLRDSESTVRSGVPEQGAVYPQASSNTFTVSLDGFTFKLVSADTPQKGDLFLLQPTVTGARNIALEVTNPASLALASPLRVTPAQANDGNVELELIEILDGGGSSSLRPGQLDRPIEIVFNAPIDGEYTFSVFDIRDPANPELIAEMENLTYTSGEPITFTDLDGNDLYQITLRNLPKAGDRFLVEFNVDGVSDNSNALSMANLQSAEAIDGFNYQNAYGQLLAKVGTQANVIKVSFMANQSILSSSEDALESVRGVNLDEEAARLIQYQQAYTASTRLITAYQDIFDSLISAVR